MQTFIDSLMAQMTLDEKLGQLNLVAPGGFAVTGPEVTQDAGDKVRKGLVGGMFGFWGDHNTRPYQDIALKESRLGIPLLFGLDIIHGHQTVFPIPLALSCSWDMELIAATARTAAIEGAADGLHWTFSPMADISRDPRWGRVAEGAGEDPYLGSLIAAAMVRGYQGDDLARHDTLVSCVKHFALYGAPDGGRDYNTVDMSRIKMFEYYMPPYKAAIDAGALTVMTAFNEVDGVPASANRWLLTDVLREQWGFDGLVVTDYTAINEMTAHGLGDLKAVSALALQAGTDMDMVGEGFITTLTQSLRDGNVTIDAINQACRRVLELKYKLGLFEDPYRGHQPAHAQKILCADHRALARAAVAQSCVLLKNDQSALPLKKNATIALIGPLADDRANMPGTWAVASDRAKCVTVREGMRAGAPDATILYAKGANITDSTAYAERIAIFGDNRIAIDPRPPAALIAEAVEAARKSDAIVAVVGEAQEMSGEAACRADIGIPPDQRALLEALSVVSRETGKPLVLAVMSGRPLTLEWEHDNAQSILACWFGGTEAGHGLADVLFGDVNPAGKLTMTFPRSVGQVPIYYNCKNTGRPYLNATGPADKFKSRYLDVDNTPLYAFGHGLSYTTFAYGDIRLSATRLSGDDAVLQAMIKLTNTGSCAGSEVVQLYIADPAASVTRPIKALRGFQKIVLKPGETRDVVFNVTTEELKFFNTDLERTWEAGEFVIHIGGSSDDTRAASVVWDALETEKAVAA